MDIWRNTERHDGIVRRFWRDFGEILPNNLVPSRCIPLHKKIDMASASFGQEMLCYNVLAY